MNTPKIPIKNLFYMLCYAWNVLPVKNTIKVSEDDFKDAYDLLGRVFSVGVGKIIKSGFHKSYISETDELSAVRGRIDIQSSLSQMTIQRKKLVCNFDDYSVNDPFNRIVRYTILSLIHSETINPEIKKVLKKQLLYFGDIDSLAPDKNVRRTLIFNQNNALYRFLISVSIMLYDNTIVNEDSGDKVFADFYREGQMQRVFELFLFNFYATHLKRSTYKVHAPKIYWHMEGTAEEDWGQWFDIETNPGDRRTDIVIENKVLNRQYILDAKYYRDTLVKRYRNLGETYRTAHLNQVRGYVLDSGFPGEKTGALIYPTVNNDFKNGTLIPISSSYIIVKTVNLNEDWNIIEADLLDFLNRLERNTSNP